MNKKSDIILRVKRLFSREEQFHEAKKNRAGRGGSKTGE